MIGYLGVPGALVRFPYRGGLSTSTDRPVSFDLTSGGRRKVFLGRNSRREWSVSVDVVASRDLHGLVDIARSAGEVMWYPADAVAGNLLSPQAAGFEDRPAGSSSGGLAELPDGTVAQTVASGSVVQIGAAHGNYEMVPVRGRVSVGAWCRGGQSFRGFWRNASGGNMGNWSAGTSSHAGWQWCTYSLDPPPGVAFLELHLAGGVQYARPTVSWGHEALDRPGRGCARAIVHGLGESLSVINGGDAYGSVDFTVSEVG